MAGAWVALMVARSVVEEAVLKVERMAARKVVHSVGKKVDGMVEKLDGRWEKYLVEMTAESWAARSVAWMVVWKVELMDV